MERLSHAAGFLLQVAEVASSLDHGTVERLADELTALRERGGRLFVVGVGGSAANGSHAVNDFRKLCEIEAYTPLDNVAELTARTNDEGWETVFAEYLRVSAARDRDALLVFSVGGGDPERGISLNIVRAVEEAKARGMKVFGVVGPRGGHTARRGDVVVVVPEVDPALVTPHTEAFQSVVWHCLVSHPALQRKATTW